MAEIICIHCGTENSSHLASCRHCGKPLQSSGAKSPDEEITKAEIPAWLQALRPDSTGGSDEAPVPPSSENEDWLLNINDDGSALPAIPTAASNIPEWLINLGDDAPEKATFESPSESLGQRSGTETTPTHDESSGSDDLLDLVGEESPEFDSSVPEWLRALGDGPSEPILEETTGPTPDPTPAPSAKVEPSSPQVGPEDDALEDLPEWMSGITDPPKEPLPEVELSSDEWLSRLDTLDQHDNEPALTETFDDDWGQLFEDDVQAEDDAAEPEMPDWLAEVETPASPSSPQDDAEEPLPDWLQATFDNAPITSEDEPEGIHTTLDSPEWFSAFESGELKPDRVKNLSTPEEPADNGPLPDWLVENLEALPSKDTDKPEEVPDWLNQLEALPKPISSEYFEPLPGEPEEIAEPEEDKKPDGYPDWLEELSSENPSFAVNEADAAAIGTSAFSSADSGSNAFEGFSDDMDKDLFEDEFTELLPETEPATDDEKLFAAIKSEQAREDKVDSGELPDWLQAMRPGSEKDQPGMVAGELQVGEVERIGPLTGLRNLLRAEPEVTQAGSPPVYSVKLQVSQRQESNVELFTQLIQEEGLVKPIEKSDTSTSQQFLRWVIAFGMILVIAALIITSSRLIPLPETLPPEAHGVNEAIDALPDQAQVLLAFEYEPGLAGELDAAAAAVIDHLMIKGARLTLVSSSPLGPILGERFIQQVEAKHNYVSGVQYTNLGYISGGITGLLNFATAPQLTVSLPFDDRLIWELFTDSPSNNAWSQPALAGVNNLSDFALTVVITDDPDIARGWIEQVEPNLTPNSLVMVISSLAEPLVRPYYETTGSPVRGIVTGLAGGAAYENHLGRENLARTYWDSYGLGIFIAQLLIIVGGAYNLVQNLITANEKAKRGDKS